MELTVRDLRRGESAVVKKVTGEGAVRRRLFDMGITPGAVITMIKTAPLGDPIEITVRGYQLSIRKKEAKSIVVAKEEG
jgi:ferrous iron transport protein A